MPHLIINVHAVLAQPRLTEATFADFPCFRHSKPVILEMHWLRSQPRFRLSMQWCGSVEVVELLCILNSPSSLALHEELNVIGGIRNFAPARVAYSGSLICTFLLDDFP